MSSVITYNKLVRSGSIEYTNNKHLNFINVLKHLDNGRCAFDVWEPIGHDIAGESDLVCSEGCDCPLYKNSMLYDTEREHLHCICSEPIFKPYYAINLDTQDIILVGSRCICKLGEKARQKHLRIKGEQEGKKYCEHCNKCVRKDVVDRAIQRGDKYFYHVKCEWADDKNIKEPIDDEEPPPPPYQPPSTISIGTIVKFGKYQGQPLYNLTKNNGYMKWMMTRDDATDQFKEIQEFIKNSNLIV